MYSLPMLSARSRLFPTVFNFDPSYSYAAAHLSRRNSSQIVAPCLICRLVSPTSCFIPA